MNRDFVEMLSALSAAGAEFIIVGAHALAAHGVARATGDIDIWVRPSEEKRIGLPAIASSANGDAPKHVRPTCQGWPKEGDFMRSDPGIDEMPRAALLRGPALRRCVARGGTSTATGVSSCQRRVATTGP